jgi:hypothetical protein
MGTTNPSASKDLDKAKTTVVEMAHHLKDEAKSVADEARQQVKKTAEAKLDAGRDFAADQLGTVADALRKTGEELRSNDSGLTDYVTKAANSVDHLSIYLQTRTLSQLINDVEGFARREPAMFLGGSFLAGLIGGRFLKSASPAPAVRSDRTRRPAALPQYASTSSDRTTSASQMKGGDTSRPTTGAGMTGAKTNDTTTGGASTTPPSASTTTSGGTPWAAGAMNAMKAGTSDEKGGISATPDKTTGNPGAADRTNSPNTPEARTTGSSFSTANGGNHHAGPTAGGR